jgi:hypothetical protein
LSDGATTGALTASGDQLPPGVDDDLTRARNEIAPELPTSILMRGMIGWIHLFGAVSFELFGQLNNVIEARDEYFDVQMRQIADLIGV